MSPPHKKRPDRDAALLRALRELTEAVEFLRAAIEESKQPCTLPLISWSGDPKPLTGGTTWCSTMSDGTTISTICSSPKGDQ